MSTDITAYWQSFTFDAIGNRASLTEHDPADTTKDVKSVYGYGTQGTGGTLTQPHTLIKVTPATGTASSGRGRRRRWTCSASDGAAWASAARRPW